ncbi:hypothetical protein [Gracilibacillus sp. YIM 98692]|uniref:hypothetical protein n=1 Tax=Gracilibacillus sp. YIM 98692 TaxID=2663532 RepID=UPI0013D6A877|nr:hypothetical protein [Gracilibacillus sp. YIM 98692]
MEEFYKKLVTEQENMKKLKRLKTERNALVEDLKRLRPQMQERYESLQKENVDVEKLESFSVTNMFYTLTGKKLEKVDKEKQEAARAHLQFQEIKASVADVEEDLHTLDDQIRDLGNPEVRYQELLHEKYDALLDKDTDSGKEALALLEQIGNLQDDKKEIQEALEVGDQVSSALSDAMTSLDKAKNWGTVDMFGGGLISTSIKHSHIDEAQYATHQAQRLLRKFSHELDDIGQSFNSNIQISGGLTFADYFLDGLIMDWFVQDKINQSAEEVESMQRKLNQTLTQLRHLLDKVSTTIEDGDRRWEQIVYHA